MVKNKGDKYKNAIINYQLPDKDKKLPLPSREDIRDSEKTEFFSIEDKDTDT